MFVFKAAVVGAGTMGGEIAQVIASAGIPVMLKDVKPEFVELGLKKAREVTAAQLGNLVSKQKITQEQADAQAGEEVARDLLGLVQTGVHELLLHVLEHDRHAGRGDHLGDLAAHRAGADHGGFEYEHLGIPSSWRR